METLPPEPKSPYAATKLDGEIYCGKYAEDGRLPTVCLRYFNVFGSRQDPRSQYAAAVPIFIERALKNEPLTIYGDGGQTRDFIFVKDIAAANIFFQPGRRPPAASTSPAASASPSTTWPRPSASSPARHRK
ncbi:MAG TPA: NAD-dependent epimerase/dehydratase family protein [Verrucomicrobiae bacterium]